MSYFTLFIYALRDSTPEQTLVLHEMYLHVENNKSNFIIIGRPTRYFGSCHATSGFIYTYIYVIFHVIYICTT